MAAAKRKAERLQHARTAFSFGINLNVEAWQRPRLLRSEDVGLSWSIPFIDAPAIPSCGSEGLLNAFLDLQDGDESDVVRFVKKWGALCVSAMPDVSAGHTTAITEMRWRESAHSYLFFARWMQAILNIAGRLHSGSLDTLEEWKTVHSVEEAFPPFSEMHAVGDPINDESWYRNYIFRTWREVEEAQHRFNGCEDEYEMQQYGQWDLLFGIFYDWLGVEGYFRLSDGNLDFASGLYLKPGFLDRFSVNYLDKLHLSPCAFARFSILVPLGIQLLLSITRSTLSRCGYCGRYFSSDRKPRPGKNGLMLCNECRPKRHADLAAESARSRRAAQKSMKQKTS
jgi:hypothetical protein